LDELRARPTRVEFLSAWHMALVPRAFVFAFVWRMIFSENRFALFRIMR
jgi:hypothetical protein